MTPIQVTIYVTSSEEFEAQEEPKKEEVTVVLPLLRKVTYEKEAGHTLITYEKIISDKRCVKIQYREAGKQVDIRIREDGVCWTGNSRDLILGLGEHSLSEDEWAYLCQDIRACVNKLYYC